ncbi:MAG: cyclic nucleotide-binding domain-containing protein [Chitinivibrionales bacterium]|nr:cyclic nucleotide-binding domain-containing protein [Chitinivibrionales bacterium]MBD3394136.1 cyclic nucleotide-binding domain-containing protein [Chitinivibrionales bacterium]
MKSLGRGKPKDKIGSGRSVVRRNERHFKRGSLMFIEGELSTEMFIIRSGKVRVLKQEGENAVELAILGPGSVLGELSLLDHQPRGATAQVIEECTATVVDEALLESTLAAVPPWLANIIKVVVKRLRDTMSRTDRDIVEKSVGGALRILLLLAKTDGVREGDETRLPLKRAKEAIHATVGIGDVETENVFLHLILKDMLYIRKSDAGSEYLVLKDLAVLQAYMNYLRAKQRGVKVVGEDFDDVTMDVVHYILVSGQKNGRRIKDKVVRIGVQQVELEMNRDGKALAVPPEAIDALAEAKAIVKENAKVQSSHGSHARDVLVYNEDTLRKVETLRQWLPTFKEDVRF